MSDYSATLIAAEIIPGLVGTAILPGLVYGINSTLIFITLRLLWKGRTADTRKRALLMMCYIAFVCILCTVHWALSCISETLSLIEFVESPAKNSPLRELDLFGMEYGVALAVPIIYTILTWLTDGLLVRVDV